MKASSKKEHAFLVSLEKLDGLAVSKWLLDSPDILANWPAPGGEGWLSLALRYVAKKPVPFSQLRDVLEAILVADRFDTNVHLPMQVACLTGNGPAFLWLIQKGHSLNFADNRNTWMAYTLDHPGWVDEGKLQVALRKRRAGPRVACDVIALTLLSGRSLSCMQRAWNGGFMSDIKASDMALLMPFSLKEALLQKQAIDPAPSQWKIDTESWDFLCQKMDEGMLTKFLGGAMEKSLAAARAGQLQQSTPECTVMLRPRI